MGFWDNIFGYFNGRPRQPQPSGPRFNNIGDYAAADPTGQLAAMDSQRYEGQGPFGFYPQGSAGNVIQGNHAANILSTIGNALNNRQGTGWASNPGAQRSFESSPWFDKLFATNFGKMGGEAGSQLIGSGAIHPPTIEDIMARLEELQNPEQYMTSQADLEKQAMAAASAQYDPVISQLQQQEESSTARANRNKVELGNMFNALSGSLKGDIPAINQQYAGDKAAAKKQFAGLQNQIKQQYASTQAEQESMMKRLGIQAAAGDVLPRQQQDRDYFTNLAATQGQTEQSALAQEQQGTVNYTRQGSELARTEGTQRQADLMTQLQDLLAQYESQIGANKAAKQNAYVSGLGQLQSQMTDQAYKRADTASSNYLNMINLGRALKSDEYKYNQAAPVSPVKSPADIAQRVLGLGLNDRQAQSIQDVFMSTLASDPIIQSGSGIFGQSVPKEQLAQRIVAVGRQRHFSQKALNALQTVALEYFGRR